MIIEAMILYLKLLNLEILNKFLFFFAAKLQMYNNRILDLISWHERQQIFMRGRSVRKSRDDAKHKVYNLRLQQFYFKSLFFVASRLGEALG